MTGNHFQLDEPMELIRVLKGFQIYNEGDKVPVPFPALLNKICRKAAKKQNFEVLQLYDSMSPFSSHLSIPLYHPPMHYSDTLSVADSSWEFPSSLAWSAPTNVLKWLLEHGFEIQKEDIFLKLCEYIEYVLRPFRKQKARAGKGGGQGEEDEDLM